MVIAIKNGYELRESKDGAFFIITDKTTNERFIFKTYGEAVHRFIELTDR